MSTEKSYRSSIPVEEDEDVAASIRRGSRQLARSLIRLGESVASIPMAFLPAGSRQHMRAAGRNLQIAGRELGMGAAEVMRAVAESIEEMAQELPEGKVTS